MTKQLTKLFVILAACAALSIPAYAQQYTLGQTTLSAKAGAGDTQLQLGSVTGVYGYGPNLQPVPSNAANPQSNCYIDREEVEVRSVPSTGTVIQVRRGVNGTTGAAHASGTMVLCGPAVAFYTNDPGGTPAVPGGPGGACTTANTLVTPWLNVRSGAQWLCSTVTLTWVPGFNNPWNATAPAPTTLVADAAAEVTPSGPFFHMGAGTNAVTGFNIPVGCNATAEGGCSFTIVPDSAWTWTTANNIATSGTAVANHAIIFTWDAKTSKFLVLQPQ